MINLFAPSIRQGVERIFLQIGFVKLKFRFIDEIKKDEESVSGYGF
ncbi:MAG TPA: hypothetical protein VK108_00545 [Pseudogracilibacillus sp.]|nr:hypothetical protein [Pseudogracilibacillus sp.]